MNVLIEVTSEGAADVLVQLAKACDRTGVSWGCFFTGDGVLNLSREEVRQALETAVTAITCELSWGQHMGECSRPVELGSQTNNSAMVGDADKVISL
jgi:hypothetical protein